MTEAYVRRIEANIDPISAGVVPPLRGILWLDKSTNIQWLSTGTTHASEWIDIEGGGGVNLPSDSNSSVVVLTAPGVIVLETESLSQGTWLINLTGYFNIPGTYDVLLLAEPDTAVATLSGNAFSRVAVDVPSSSIINQAIALTFLAKVTTAGTVKVTGFIENGTGVVAPTFNGGYTAVKIGTPV